MTALQHGILRIQIWPENKTGKQALEQVGTVVREFSQVPKNPSYSVLCIIGGFYTSKRHTVKILRSGKFVGLTTL